MCPGLTQFARTLYFAHSTAIDLVKDNIPHFVAPYTEHPPRILPVLWEPILMMLPPFCSFIYGATACVTKKTPFKLIAMIRSYVSSVTSIKPSRLLIPAQFTNTSIWPYFSPISFTHPEILPLSMTFITWQEASPPAASISRRTFSNCSLLMSHRAIFPPASAIPAAIALPMPPAAPVNKTTFSSNENIFCKFSATDIVYSSSQRIWHPASFS